MNRPQESYFLISKARPRRHRRGITTIYAIILMTSLVGFISFAVDWGRLQLAKTQLQQAADSAARAAVVNLGSGVTATQNAAVTWGGYNSADGTSVVIDPTNDVDFGTWDPAAQTFTVLSGASRTNANSVRVWGRRLASRGTAIHLAFGVVIGESTCDATMSSIAYSPSLNGYYFVGMSSATLQNNTISTDSYASASGAYNAATAGSQGYIASNGNISLKGGTINVKNNLYMTASATLTTTGTVSYGTRNTLSSNIVWPTPVLGSVATSNDNASIGEPTSGGSVSLSSGSFSVPPGTYYLHSINMSGGTITISGPTYIYMDGAVTITGGTLDITSGHPGDLVFEMTTASSFALSGGSPFYADIEAPTSTISLAGITDFYGRAIGSTLTANGSIKLHADTSLPAISGASTPSGSAGSGISVVH